MVVDQRDDLSGAGYHLNYRGHHCGLSVWSTDMTEERILTPSVTVGELMDALAALDAQS